MNDFAIMQYAAGGMDAQRSALNVLARNVAVAQTADRDHPVHPLDPQFAVAGDGAADDDGAQFSAALAMLGSDAGADEVDAAPQTVEDDAEPQMPGDDAGPLPGQVVFAGASPGARSVTGIDAVSEMVAVLGAQRAFEADASVFDTGKRLVQKTLDVENAL